MIRAEELYAELCATTPALAAAPPYAEIAAFGGTVETGPLNNRGRDLAAAVATATILGGRGDVLIYTAGRRAARFSIELVRKQIDALDQPVTRQNVNMLEVTHLRGVCTVHARSFREPGPTDVALIVLLDARYMDRAWVDAIRETTPVLVLTD